MCICQHWLRCACLLLCFSAAARTPVVPSPAKVRERRASAADVTSVASMKTNKATQLRVQMVRSSYESNAPCVCARACVYVSAHATTQTQEALRQRMEEEKRLEEEEKERQKKQRQLTKVHCILCFY